MKKMLFLQKIKKMNIYIYINIYMYKYKQYIEKESFFL